MANETKRGQWNEGVGGGNSDKNADRSSQGGQSGQAGNNDQSERPKYAEKQGPGQNVDPNKEDQTRKDAGQGGSQRDQSGFQQPGQGGGYEQPGQSPFRKEGDSGRSDRSDQSQTQKK
jgi:hypothetical protein